MLGERKIGAPPLGEVLLLSPYQIDDPFQILPVQNLHKTQAAAKEQAERKYPNPGVGKDICCVDGKNGGSPCENGHMPLKPAPGYFNEAAKAQKKIDQVRNQKAEIVPL